MIEQKALKIGSLNDFQRLLILEIPTISHYTIDLLHR